MNTTLTGFSYDSVEPKLFPDDARLMPGVFDASLTLAKGTVLAVNSSTNKLKAYKAESSSESAGASVAIGVLRFAICTDSDGNIFYGDSTVKSSDNLPHESAPYWIHGTFDPDDFSGWDDDALADLNGRELDGGLVAF